MVLISPRVLIVFWESLAFSIEMTEFYLSLISFLDGATDMDEDLIFKLLFFGLDGESFKR